VHLLWIARSSAIQTEEDWWSILVNSCIILELLSIALHYSLESLRGGDTIIRLAINVRFDVSTATAKPS
jgi:hypothetical protein